MKTGRPRKPTALHLIEGTARPHRMPKAEPKPAPIRPTMPTYLKGEGRKHWTALASKLERLGVLTEIDQDVLGIYCDAFGRWREAEVHIRRDGAVIAMGDKGYLSPNPWLQVRNRALDDMRRLAPELGIGAASRSRIDTRKSEESSDPLGEIIEANRQRRETAKGRAQR